MTLHTVQPGQARGRPRRKVRILKPKSKHRTALICLGLVIAAAVSFPLFWSASRSEEPAPETKPLPEREWKCDGGHILHAPITAEARSCWECGRPAYPVVWYTCAVHGSFEVTAQLAEDEGGKLRPTLLRLTGRKWVTGEDLLCPRCERQLAYKGRDPLERAQHATKVGGS